MRHASASESKIPKHILITPKTQTTDEYATEHEAQSTEHSAQHTQSTQHSSDNKLVAVAYGSTQIRSFQVTCTVTLISSQNTVGTV